ncbi:MAG: hypothetical protein HYZ45_06705 [Burkholderiales bacterium]|nr:hypothetical protein [Burkholderiales bacterium]
MEMNLGDVFFWLAALLFCFAHDWHRIFNSKSTKREKILLAVGILVFLLCAWIFREQTVAFFAACALVALCVLGIFAVYCLRFIYGKTDPVVDTLVMKPAKNAVTFSPVSQFIIYSVFCWFPFVVGKEHIVSFSNERFFKYFVWYVLLLSLYAIMRYLKKRKKV